MMINYSLLQLAVISYQLAVKKGEIMKCLLCEKKLNEIQTNK